MFGAKQHKIERLQALVDVYGAALERHHDSKGTCEDVRGERDTLRTRVAALEKKLIAVGHAVFRVPEGES